MTTIFVTASNAQEQIYTVLSLLNRCHGPFLVKRSNKLTEIQHVRNLDTVFIQRERQLGLTLLEQRE